MHINSFTVTRCTDFDILVLFWQKCHLHEMLKTEFIQPGQVCFSKIKYYTMLLWPWESDFGFGL